MRTYPESETLLMAYHNVEPPTLAMAQRFVGGMVEQLTLPDGRQLLVNEDGIPLHLQYNRLASLLWGGPIVGPAILLSGSSRWT